MSRRPDPLERRIGKGNPQRRPMPKNAPERVSEAPEAPSWLDGHALDCWHRVGALLIKRGQWSADSEVSLTALCTTFGEWVELAQDIKANGRFQTVRTRAGAGTDDEAGYMERVRPAVAAFQDADRRLKGWLVEFGLTDASRGKVQAEPSSEVDSVLERYGLQ